MPDTEEKLEPTELEVKVEKPKKIRVVRDRTNDDVVEAAKKLIAYYEKTHQIKSDADYRYPGLLDLVVALRN